MTNIQEAKINHQNTKITEILWVEPEEEFKARAITLQRATMMQILRELEKTLKSFFLSASG